MFADWLDKTFIPTNKQRLQNAYKMTCDALGEVGIPYLPGDCGLFIWVDFREVQDYLTHLLHKCQFTVFCIESQGRQGALTSD